MHTKKKNRGIGRDKILSIALSLGLLLTIFFSIYTLAQISRQEESETTEDPKVSLRGTVEVDVKKKVSDIIFIDCGNGIKGVLNDGYCDCTENGIDEPETAGCSYFVPHRNVFHCKSSSKMIFLSRVGDGFQDCKDGSDEIR